MTKNNQILRSTGRMTLKEIAEKTGAAYRTVADYAQKAGWTENGKQTLLDERQATLILEAMKAPVSSGHKSNLAVQLQGTETSQSRVLKLHLLQRQMQDIYEAEIADLKAKAETDRPKVEFFDQVAGTGDYLGMREAAAALDMPGWGRNNLFAMLKDRNVLDRNNIPYREYQERGYFKVIEQTWKDNAGEPHVSLKTLVHPQRGVDFMRKLILKEAE